MRKAIHSCLWPIFASEIRAPTAVPVIKRLQGQLAESINNIVSRRSVYYWLHIYRRNRSGRIEGTESVTTVALYTNMAECAFLKYGHFRTDGEFVTIEKPSDFDAVASGNYKKAIEVLSPGQTRHTVSMGGVYLKDFGFDDLVEMVQVERLAAEYWYTTTCLRRLYKGGLLSVDRIGEYHVENNSETESLMGSFDSRQTSAYSTSGVPMLPAEPGGNARALIPCRNAGDLATKDYPLWKLFSLESKVVDEGEFVPNFIWYPMSFDYLEEQYSYCAQQYVKRHGNSLQEVVASLYVMARLGTQLPTPAHLLEVIQRAYRVWPSERALIADACHLAPLLLPRIGRFKRLELDELAFERVLSQFRLTPTFQQRISLTTMGPRPFLLPLDDGRVVMDLAALGPILSTLVHGVDHDGQKKGRLFEASIAKRVRRLPAPVRGWVNHQKLEHPDGTSREIDASFYLKGFLFICEAKSVGRSFGFEEGTAEALAFRREKLESALRDVDQRADWLVKHPHGSNYKIPTCIKALVPLVVSPFKEYVWSTRPHLWLTKDIPRVCTPDELEGLTTDEALAEIASKPYVRFLV